MCRPADSVGHQSRQIVSQLRLQPSRVRDQYRALGHGAPEGGSAGIDAQQRMAGLQQLTNE